MTDIRQSLDLAYKQLNAYSATAVLDAEVLLAHVLNKDRTFLYAHPEMILNKEDFLAFQQLVTRRSLGVPIAYLTGTREFWSLPITVNTETLIPRPETELIVELALKLVEETQPARILDLGTGSGAIALALGKERPRWEVTACDCSPGALKTAQENAARLHLTNINFFHSDWFTNIEFTKPFQAIVSNPPYIAANDPHLQQGDIRFEPSLALIADGKGLSALQIIIEQAFSKLDYNGILLIEHGYDQKQAVRSMLNQYGYESIETWQDMQGIDRVSGGRRGR